LMARSSSKLNSVTPWVDFTVLQNIFRRQKSEAPS
jgi:hypothetical protein